MSVGDYLAKHGIPGISEVDTRALTKKLRVDGAMKCCLSTLPISRRRGGAAREVVAGHGRCRLRKGRFLQEAVHLAGG
jgi:carbamoylphosphate synthase small subunit